MNVPGASVGIVVDGESVLCKGYGLRSVEEVQPVTPNTQFAVGSITKPMTTFLMGQLVDDGILDWDDPISEHIPYFRLKDPYLTHEITIRDYLTHISGYPRHDGVWYHNNMSRKELVKRLKSLDRVAAFRDKFIYQNIGFAIAAHAAENATGKSWETLMSEKLFKPLGMNETGFTLAEFKKHEDRSHGHRETRKEVYTIPYVDISTIGPAGGIHSNADNMMKWMKLILKKGDGLIQERTWNEIISPQVVSNLIGKSGYGLEDVIPLDVYGIGWYIASYRGHLLLFHGGNTEGFSSAMLILPKDGIAMTIMTNKHYSPCPFLLGSYLMDRMLGLEPIDWLERVKAFSSDYSKDFFQANQDKPSVHRYENTEPSHPLHDYQGVYHHPGYGDVEIKMNKNRLQLNKSSLILPLHHWHYDVFEISEEANNPLLEGLKVSFHENVYGDICTAQIAFEPIAPDILFIKQKDQRFFHGDYLDQFIGNYSHHGFGFFVEREEEKLIVKAMGQPPYDLVPEREGMFKIKNFDGYTVQFTRDEESGEINSIMLVQPDNTVYTAHRY